MSIGQDWWRWDDDFNFWRAILGGGTTEPVPVDPDPEPDPDDPFPDPTGRQVLLVTESGTLGTGNQALHDILVGDGWTVTVRALADPEDFADVSVLVMSAGNPTAGDTGSYLFPPVGVVAVDSWRRLGMGAGLGYANSPLTVEVVDPSSPLAAGYSGTFEAYQSSAWLTWKPETDSEQTVVTRAGQPTERVVFAYEAGSQMPGRYATTRHVGLGYHEEGFAAGLSPQARAQFLAAVRWARDTAVVPVGLPAAPTGLAALATDSQVRLSWNAADFATSYTPKRATVTGGPYTTLATGVAGQSYTDSTAVNDTTYYYVVSANNAAGEGPNSAEVSATPSVSSSETVAALVSSDEIALWKSRSASGPFRTSGDFSANSPGHWSEMSAAMSLNFSAHRWDGPEVLNPDGSVLRGNVPPGDDGVTRAPPDLRRLTHDMMSAAYAAITVGNFDVPQRIVAEIEWQATRPLLDYSNRTLWPYSYYDDIGPLFQHANWVKDYVFAYDVCKAMGYTSAIAEQWFLDLADLCEQSVRSNLTSVFPNRGSDSYSTRSSFVNSETSIDNWTAAGTGIVYPRIARFYNNRRSNLAGYAGLAGVVLNNTYQKNEFKRYAREWLMFAHRATALDGLFPDTNRGSSTFPQLGLSYSLHGMEALIPAMDALARQGDTSLYEFSSSDGAATPAGSTNHLKTMEQVIDGYIKWVDGSWPAQYTPSSSNAGDPKYRVQTRNTMSGREVINDAMLLLPANYYNRTDWHDAILRQGTPSGFTERPQSVGMITGWRCDWRHRFLRSLDTNPYGGV